MKKAVIQKGAAMVEFAIVLPLFLVLVFGIIEYSLMLYDQALITNASREAARSAIAFRSPKLTTAQITAVVTNYCNGNLISFGSVVSPTVTVTPVPTPTTAPITATAGTSITVRVDYNYNFLILGSLLNILSGGSIANPQQLSAITVMNNE